MISMFKTKKKELPKKDTEFGKLTITKTLRTVSHVEEDTRITSFCCKDMKKAINNSMIHQKEESLYLYRYYNGVANPIHPILLEMKISNCPFCTRAININTVKTKQPK